MRYYCRRCSKFVLGPLARCNGRGCGHQHTRDEPALEEPIRTRRRKRPKRDGWEHLLGR